MHLGWCSLPNEIPHIPCSCAMLDDHVCHIRVNISYYFFLCLCCISLPVLGSIGLIDIHFFPSFPSIFLVKKTIGYAQSTLCHSTFVPEPNKEQCLSVYMCVCVCLFVCVGCCRWTFNRLGEQLLLAVCVDVCLCLCYKL